MLFKKILRYDFFVSQFFIIFTKKAARQFIEKTDLLLFYLC